MELRHLHYFVAVAEELHFGRAAARLFMAQPPLSRQIQQLEQELGVALFTREKKRVRLTNAGCVFLEETRLTLAQAEKAAEAARRAGEGLTGSLNVGFAAPAVYSVLPAITRAFRERFPGVELTLTEMCMGRRPECLSDPHIQVGFVLPGIQNDQITSAILCEEPFVAVLPESHPLARRRRIALAELAQEPFVLSASHTGPSLHEETLRHCRSAGFLPRIAQETTPQQTLLALVASGVGISLLPASLRRVRQPGVAYRSLRAPVPTVPLAVAWRKNDTSPIVANFVALAQEVTQSEKRSLAP